jgi:hypothetical protein
VGRKRGRRHGIAQATGQHCVARREAAASLVALVGKSAEPMLANFAEILQAQARVRGLAKLRFPYWN